MATLHLLQGINLLVYTGQRRANLADLDWYVPANVEQVFVRNGNGQGWLSGKPGSPFGPQALVPSTDNSAVGIIVVMKQALTLDTDLFSLRPTLPADFVPVDSPVIFQASPTAMPGDSLVVSGHFSASATLWLRPADDAPLVACPLLQTSRVAHCLHALVPGTLPLAAYRLVVQDGDNSSPPFLINQVDAHFLDWCDAVPGASARLIGRNLLLGGAAQVSLQASDGTRTPATVDASSSTAEELHFTYPSTLPLGSYTLFVRSALGGEVAMPDAVACLAPVVPAFPLPDLDQRVAARHAYLSKGYQLSDSAFDGMRPVGDGVADDTAALKQCLTQLSFNLGGGLLDLQGGTFRLQTQEQACAHVFGNAALLNGTLRYGYGTPPGLGYGVYLDSAASGLYNVTLVNANEQGNYNHNAALTAPQDVFLVNVTGSFSGEPLTQTLGTLSRLYVKGGSLTTRYDPRQPLNGGPFTFNSVTNCWVDGLATVHEVGQLAVQSGRNVLMENCRQTRDAALNNRAQNPHAQDTRGLSVNLVENFAWLRNTCATINGVTTDLNDGETLLNEGGAASRPNAEFGTVTSATPTVLTDAGASFGTRHAVTAGAVVCLVGGRGLGQWRRVTSSTATTLTLDSAWAVVPDATSTYTLTDWSARNWTLSGNVLTGNRAGISLFAAACLNVLVRGNTLTNSHAILLRPYQNTGGGARYFTPCWGVQLVGNTVQDTDNPTPGVPAYVGVSASTYCDPGQFVPLIGSLTLGVEVRGNTLVASPTFAAVRSATGAAAYNDYRQLNGYLGISDNQFIDPALGLSNNGSVPLLLGLLFDGNVASNCASAYALDNAAFGTTIRRRTQHDCAGSLLDQAQGDCLHASQATTFLF